jgi:hypothetical protein
MGFSLHSSIVNRFAPVKRDRGGNLAAAATEDLGRVTSGEREAAKAAGLRKRLGPPLGGP